MVVVIFVVVVVVATVIIEVVATLLQDAKIIAPAIRQTKIVSKAPLFILPPNLFYFCSDIIKGIVFHIKAGKNFD